MNLMSATKTVYSDILGWSHQAFDVYVVKQSYSPIGSNTWTRKDGMTGQTQSLNSLTPSIHLIRFQFSS